MLRGVSLHEVLRRQAVWLQPSRYRGTERSQEFLKAGGAWPSDASVHSLQVYNTDMNSISISIYAPVPGVPAPPDQVIV